MPSSGHSGLSRFVKFGSRGTLWVLPWSPRGVAQLGSARALGARGRRFESGRPDSMAKGERLREDDVEHYRILSEMVSDYAFRTRLGEDGVPILEWMSDSWLRDFGYVPGGPEDIFEHVNPDDRQHVAKQWAELLAGRPIEGELRLMPKQGRELWVHYRVKPIV